jgi:hypothetical protein
MNREVDIIVFHLKYNQSIVFNPVKTFTPESVSFSMVEIYFFLMHFSLGNTVVV